MRHQAITWAKTEPVLPAYGVTRPEWANYKESYPDQSIIDTLKLKVAGPRSTTDGKVEAVKNIVRLIKLLQSYLKFVKVIKEAFSNR